MAAPAPRYRLTLSAPFFNGLLEAELTKWQRKANLHAKVKVADAMKAFEPALKVDRKPKTIGDIQDAMAAFLKSLPENGRERLGSINAGHVDNFLVHYMNGNRGT